MVSLPSCFVSTSFSGVVFSANFIIVYVENPDQQPVKGGAVELQNRIPKPRGLRTLFLCELQVCFNSMRVPG
jgi:hypothetical protein